MKELKIFNTKIHVEIPVLVSFFSIFLVDSISSNLTIYRTCYLILGYNVTECALLGQNESGAAANLEKLVEPTAATISMVRHLVDQLFNVMLCFFIGPWSDQFGRKLLIALPLLGFTCSSIMTGIFTLFPNISPWYFMICSIPQTLTGGGLTFITGVLSYITDVTNVENRGIRMGAFEAMIAIGSLLGNLCSSYLFAATDYVGVYMVAAFISFLGFVFTLCCIPESLERDSDAESAQRGLFSATNVKEVFSVTFKKRDHFNRTVLLSGILILSLYMFSIFGDGSVMFLFLREKLHWTLRKFTLFSCFSSIFWVFGTTVGIYVLSKLLKIPEVLVAFAGLMCVFTSSLMQGLATQDLHIYLAVAIRGMGGVISPMVRTLITKIIPIQEIGKIFSFIIGAESVIGLFSSPIYTEIYNSTININPSIFNFFSAAVFGVTILLNLIMMYLRRHSGGQSGYEILINS